MREIAAASDFDFVALEPRRPKKKSAPRAAAKKPSPLARVWRFKLPLLGALAMTGLLGGIVVNAMFLQHGRHPAPLLGGATVRIAQPAPRPAPFSPLLNDQIPRPALQKVEAAPDAAFAAPTAAPDDEPAADAPADAAAAAAPAAGPAAARPAHPASDHGARETHAHNVPTPNASKPNGQIRAEKDAHPHPAHAHAAKKAADPIAALLAGAAR